MEKMTHGYQNVWYSSTSALNSAKVHCTNVSWRSIKKQGFLFYRIKLS